MRQILKIFFKNRDPTNAGRGGEKTREKETSRDSDGNEWDRLCRSSVELSGNLRFFFFRVFLFSREPRIFKEVDAVEKSRDKDKEAASG